MLIRDNQNHPAGILEINRDITERKRAEEALHKSHDEEYARSTELRAVMDAMPVAMFISRDPECRNIIGNRSAYRLLREPPGSNLSKSTSEGQQPAFRAFQEGKEIPSYELPLQKAVATGQSVYDLELELAFQDGTRVNTIGNAVPLLDSEGRARGAVGVLVDITERKRTEKRLRQAQKLESIGLLAGGIAHEINNPLAVIHASAANISRIAESGSVPLPVVLKNSHRISQTADRISRIVGSLRHVARESSADEFRETSVREIVEETLELCAERFRAHNIRLAVSAVDPEADINCREAQICQVLLNLLQNAFDELVDLEGERWVRLDVSYCPGWAVFSVSDSGPGIAPEHRADIMEPFFTTKPVGKGVGLGLSISRSIALEHGGTLELDEESPHTCFRLKLPRCHPPPAREAIKNRNWRGYTDGG